jgi:AAA+ superfamily predicted ATPase
MTATTDTDPKALAGNEGVTKAAQLPAHFPAWAKHLAELYFSGTTSMFVLHGNVFDVVRSGSDPDPRFGGLSEFLAEQLFGRWDVVLHYDLARGLRCLAGADAKRLQRMVTTMNRWLGDLTKIPRDPTNGLAALDLFVRKNVMAEPGERVRAAIIVDHGSYVASRGDRLSLADQTHLVTLLNWATSPYGKRLIERQAQGMLEFIEPKWGLDTVVGHDAAKKRLADDAELIRRGELDSVPMGYLFCGPVGTGKSFLATCVAGSIGIPCVVLKNFRSKYVGETEGNLERVLGVLRSMGPVVVVVDEADAMLGDRDQGGDSGVSGRVFGMIAAQMGDTAYRGKIVWMLLTARPDQLPIDLKRQGRAEVHVPLFYPHEDEELRRMFVILAKKAGTSLAEEDLPESFAHKGNLSGADIEGLIGRALRTSLLGGSRTITREALAGALEGFMPSTQTLEREAQELAAIIECTDLEFLPPAKRQKLEELGGREALQERFNAIKQILEGR